MRGPVVGAGSGWEMGDVTKHRLATDGDLAMLRYFHENRGDMTRYVGWEEIKDDFKARYPHVFDAWERHASAERTLDILIQELPEYP